MSILWFFVKGTTLIFWRSLEVMIQQKFIIYSNLFYHNNIIATNLKIWLTNLLSYLWVYTTLFTSMSQCVMQCLFFFQTPVLWPLPTASFMAAPLKMPMCMFCRKIILEYLQKANSWSYIFVDKRSCCCGLTMRSRESLQHLDHL